MTKPYYTRLEDGVGYRLSDLVRDTSELDWACTTTNELKAVYNAHLASTTYHTAADAVNVLASPDATDLASLIVLLNEARIDYEAHRVLVGVGPVHGSADATHVLTAPVAADLETAVALMRDIADKYFRHRADISGTPAIHLAEDDARFFWQYVNKVAYFGGRIEDVLEAKKKATAGAPFILVQAQGGNPKMINVGGTYYRETRVSLLLISRNARGQVEQRRGSGIALEDPGLYQMVEDVCDRLVNKMPVDGYGVAVPSQAWRLITDEHKHGEPDIQIWLLTFQAKVAHQWDQIDRTGLDDLSRADGEGDLYDAGVKTFDALEMTLTEWP